MLLNSIIHDALDFVLHLDHYLESWVATYQSTTYAILFAIIFVETGLVIMPFLPGDSLLFTAGMIAAQGDNQTLSIWVLIPLLILAALAGDNTNYFIGNKIGVRIFNLNWRFLKKEYLERTRLFFDKYGAMTVILARYVPIVRTFTPFVAGMGGMKYFRFLVYSLIAATVWVSVLSLAGYFLGNIPWVKKNFDLVILGILATSFVPIVFQFLKNYKKQKNASA